MAVGGPEQAVDIRPGLAAKLDACPAYGSQLGFQLTAHSRCGRC
ncbi:MAG TPA: hypothetical protein VHN80_05630 [Kineosporiaceae bacterium]|nr:hypothetical protein [Kineosporiaceae bacterium]